MYGQRRNALVDLRYYIQIYLYLQNEGYNYIGWFGMEFADIKMEIRKAIEMECPICYKEYDSVEVVPMLICIGQHSICAKCVTAIFDLADDDYANCPICNESFEEEFAFKFRLMDDVVRIAKQIEELSEMKQKEIAVLKNENGQLNQELLQQKIINKKSNQKLREAKEEISKLNKSKNTVISAKNQQNHIKSKQSHRSVSRYIKSSATRQEKTRNRLLTSTDQFDQEPLFLLPKAVQRQRTETNRLNRNPHSYSQWFQFLDSSKHRLPYFANKRSIEIADLREINKTQNNSKVKSVRQICIDILREYDFSRVEVLNLSNIGFTAEYFLPLMPDSHTLCNLRSIDLSKNRIAAFPDLLLELRRVRVLNLNHNLLEEIPQDIDLLQRLEVLLLWNNKLAFLPDTISLLQHLTEVEISNNLFQQIQNCFLNCKALRKLSLQGNPLHQTESNHMKLRSLIQKKVKLDIE